MQSRISIKQYKEKIIFQIKISQNNAALRLNSFKVLYFWINRIQQMSVKKIQYGLRLRPLPVSVKFSVVLMSHLSLLFNEWHSLDKAVFWGVWVSIFHIKHWRGSVFCKTEMSTCLDNNCFSSFENRKIHIYLKNIIKF